MTSLRVITLSLLLPLVASFFTGNSFPTPGLRQIANRNAALSICMGRKPATVGSPASTTRERVREKKVRDPSIPIEIKVKKITGVDESRNSIVNKLRKVTKETFAENLLNEKVITFLTKEAGSSLYPRLMRGIKSKAKELGVQVPERFAYEAKANAKSRGLLSKKIEAKQAAATAAAAEPAPAAA